MVVPPGGGMVPTSHCRSPPTMVGALESMVGSTSIGSSAHVSDNIHTVVCHLSKTNEEIMDLVLLLQLLLCRKITS